MLNVEREENLTRQLNHHERTWHRITPGCSQVEKQLQEIEEYSHKNKMQINQKKTKLMLFNSCRNFYFQSDMELSGVMIELIN